ncbi:MAG: choice-of-anchor Q domain-containing protein [Chloroflexota bacterium]
MHRTRGRTLSVLLAASLLGPAGVVAVAPPVALGATCSVTLGAKHYTSLTTAIAKAPAGATLTVSGSCRGAFTVTKKLTLKSGSPAGILKGAAATVLTVNGGPLKVIGLTITGGKATTCPTLTNAACGGGIVVASGVTLSLSRVRLIGNQVVGAGLRPIAYGGAIFSQGTVTIVASTISGNSVTGTSFGIGGAVDQAGGSLTIRRSLLSANSASGDGRAVGGAIAATSAAVTITDSTLSGNHVSSAGTTDGGAYVDAADSPTNPSLHLSGSTVTLNDGGPGGTGGIIANGDVHIDSTIIAGNTGSPPDCSLGNAVSLNLSDDLVGVATGCGAFTNGVDGNLVGADPALAPLANNGGPTRTHRLLNGSDAIGAAGAGPCLTDTDQRGVHRPQGAACDIGAYER